MFGTLFHFFTLYAMLNKCQERLIIFFLLVHHVLFEFISKFYTSQGVLNIYSKAAFIIYKFI